MDDGITFGQVVRERRSILGLTQTELARRVGCAAITIRKIEADDLRPSVQMAELIALALNVPEEEQLSFVRLARAEKEPSPIPTPSPSPGEIGQRDLSGRAVKGFQLGEKIGSGGFGVVYRAVQPSIERDVAVKIILPKYANHPNFIRRFEAEAQLIARLEHPHIVPLYDYWREPNAAYLIMRLLRGGSLGDQLKEGPIPVELVYRFTQQIGLALDVAHRNGVIHRDIKPANVLLDEESNAYLADFGIATNLESVSGLSLTEGNALIGSSAYISPEQILAEPVKPQSDIYCLGIMLFEMLTGQKPFSGPTPVAFIHQHLNERLPSLQVYDPQLPPELDEVIRNATAREVADRYRDVPSLLGALRQALVPVSELFATPIPGETPLELTAQELVELENPYKGLRAFSEADAEDFHGRDTLIQELFAKLSEESELARLLAVVGPSGSGKSSVIKAGLVPALRRGGLPGSENWFVLDLSPGAHPWEEVEAALLRVAVNPPETLLNQLQDGDRGLLRAVRRVLPNDGETELVLIIDQFEELFTMVAEESVREQFLNSLVTAVLDERSRLWVIITLRADYYDRPLQYVDFGDVLRQRTVSVLPMTPDELEQAIIRPALGTGVRLEHGLAATIMRDVGSQPGTLPLLQYVLTELFERRDKNVMTQTAYKALGGVSGSLARRANEIYESLDEDGRTATRQLFLRLVTLGEGVEDTRRRVLRSELEALSEQPLTIDNQQLVIGNYGAARLLTFDRDPVTREPTVEVAHEALLREWGRLRSWLSKNRDDIRLQRLLAGAATEWQVAGRDSGFLLREARLDQFVGWEETTNVVLTADERAYLHTSFDARETRLAEEENRRQRELETAQELAKTESRRAEEQAQAAGQLRRRRRYLVGALALAVLLALAAAIFGVQATNERNAALLRSQLARQALALQAREDLANFPQRALLMALEAAQTTDNVGAPPTVEAEQALRDSLAQVGGQVLPSPDGPVSEAAFSPDGRWLAWNVSPGEGIFWLWDLNADDPQGYRYEVRTQPDAGSSSDIHFTGDGRWLAWAVQGVVQLWDLASASPAEDSIELGEKNPLNAPRLDYDPERQWLAASTTAFNFSNTHVLKLWDLSSKNPASTLLQSPPQPGFTGEISFSPDGRWLLSTGLAPTANVIEDGDLPRLWDLTSGKLAANPIVLGGIEAALASTTVSGDGRWLAAGDVGNRLYLWDLATPNPAVDPLVLQLDDAPIGESQATGVWWHAFSRDKRKLFAVLGSTIWRWDMTPKGPAGQPDIFRAAGEIVDTTLSPDDRWLVTVDDAGEALRWDLSTEDPTGHPVKLSSDDLPVVRTIFSDDGRWLTAQVIGNVVQLWDFSDPERIIGPIALGGHEATVTEATLSPDGRRLVTGDVAQMVRVWDLENLQTGSDPVSIPAHEDEVWALVAGPDNRWLASGSADGEIRLWEMDGGTPSSGSILLPGHVAGIKGLAFTSDGRRLVSGSEDGVVLLWNLRNGDPAVERVVLDGLETGMNALALSQVDERLVTGGADGSIQLWNLSAPGDPTVFHGHEGSVEAVAISPNGRWLASGGADNVARLWDLTAAEQAATAIVLPDHIQEVTALAFTPDSRWLATGSVDRTARLWDLSADNPAADPVVLEGHSDLINVLAISPDGTRLATAGDIFLENTARLWDLTVEDPAADESRFPPILLPGQEAEAKSIAITADSHWLVLGGEDGRLTFWRLKIEDLVESACKAVGRNLSLAEWEQFFPGDAYRQSCPEWPAADGTAPQETRTALEK